MGVRLKREIQIFAFIYKNKIQYNTHILSASLVRTLFIGQFCDETRPWIEYDIVLVLVS